MSEEEIKALVQRVENAFTAGYLQIDGLKALVALEEEIERLRKELAFMNDAYEALAAQRVWR